MHKKKKKIEKRDKMSVLTEQNMSVEHTQCASEIFYCFFFFMETKQNI